MARYIFVLVSVFVCSSAFATQLFAGNLSINRVRLDSGNAYFRTTPQPPETCSNWGEYIRFDPTTTAGKNFLSALLTAKASGKQIDVWYSPSSQPGTDQTNGCGAASISGLTGIAIE